MSIRKYVPFVGVSSKKKATLTELGVQVVQIQNNMKTLKNAIERHEQLRENLMFRLGVAMQDEGVDKLMVGDAFFLQAGGELTYIESLSNYEITNEEKGLGHQKRISEDDNSRSSSSRGTANTAGKVLPITLDA